MITSDQLIDIVDDFRSACFERYPKDTDLLSTEERRERFGYSKALIPSDYLSILSSEPIRKLCEVIKTPRLLKTILRRTLNLWEALHGEIDLDDLLVANAIRFAAPEAFDFLLENFREIRALATKDLGQDSNKRKEHLRDKWKRHIDKVDWDVATVEGLIGFLFPSWKSETIPATREVPQGVSVAEPSDYWIRFIVGELAKNEVRDQEILRALRGWKQNESGNHFRGMSLPLALGRHTDFSPKFEQFAPGLLGGKELRKLASSLFEILLREHGVKANHDSSPGFIHLWRCAIRAPIESTEHTDWIRNEVFICLPKSFQLANELYYWWRTNNESEIKGVGRNYVELRNSIIEEARTFYQGNPKRFVSVLDRTYLYASRHFAMHFSEADQGGSGFEAEEWVWFGHLLVEAGLLNPDVIVSQIASLVFDQKMTLGNSLYDFNQQRARALFRDDFKKMVEVLSVEIDTAEFSEEQRQFLTFARETARSLLESGELA